jgi:hypothetical protein
VWPRIIFFCGDLQTVAVHPFYVGYNGQNKMDGLTDETERDLNDSSQYFNPYENVNFTDSSNRSVWPRIIFVLRFSNRRRSSILFWPICPGAAMASKSQKKMNSWPD